MYEANRSILDSSMRFRVKDANLGSDFVTGLNN